MIKKLARRHTQGRTRDTVAALEISTVSHQSDRVWFEQMAYVGVALLILASAGCLQLHSRGWNGHMSSVEPFDWRRISLPAAACSPKGIRQWRCSLRCTDGCTVKCHNRAICIAKRYYHQRFLTGALVRDLQVENGSPGERGLLQRAVVDCIHDGTGVLQADASPNTISATPVASTDVSQPERALLIKPPLPTNQISIGHCCLQQTDQS